MSASTSTQSIIDPAQQLIIYNGYQLNVRSMTIKELNTEGNKLQNIWYLLNSQKNLGSIITDIFQECNGRSGGISQLTPYRLR